MWWSSMDPDFLSFLENLFGGEVTVDDVQMAQAKAIKPNAGVVKKQNPILTEIQSITASHEKAATAPPAPSPSGPSPAPTASPTPSPTAPQGNKAMSVDELMARMADAFAQRAQGTATPKDPYQLTPQSPVWESDKPNWVIKDEQGRRSTHGGPQTRSLTDVAMDPYRWDAEKAKKMADLMENAGYDTKGGNIDQMATIWKGFTITAANFWQVGKKVSPLDVLKRISDGVQAAQPRTTTSTSTQVSVTNALTAEQLVQAALSQRLGRRATKIEVDEFKKALRAAEEKDPTTTTTTTTTDPKGNTTSSSKTEQGVSASDFALQWSMGHNKEEAAAFQAAGLMIPWLFEALKSPV